MRDKYLSDTDQLSHIRFRPHRWVYSSHKQCCTIRDQVIHKILGDQIFLAQSVEIDYFIEQELVFLGAYMHSLAVVAQWITLATQGQKVVGSTPIRIIGGVRKGIRPQLLLCSKDKSVPRPAQKTLNGREVLYAFLCSMQCNLSRGLLLFSSGCQHLSSSH